MTEAEQVFDFALQVTNLFALLLTCWARDIHMEEAVKKADKKLGSK